MADEVEVKDPEARLKELLTAQHKEDTERFNAAVEELKAGRKEVVTTPAAPAEADQAQVNAAADQAAIDAAAAEAAAVTAAPAAPATEVAEVVPAATEQLTPLMNQLYA